jgi:uncharacterized cofD-like protein
MPNLLVRDVKGALVSTAAKKIYISNLFTQPGHTDDFTVSDFTKTISKYMGEDIFTHIVYNNRPIPKEIFVKYKNSIISSQVSAPLSIKKDKRFRGRSIAKLAPRVASASDPIAKIRNPFLHDSKKLAKTIMELI